MIQIFVLMLTCATLTAHAFSPLCAIGLKKCATIQGSLVPIVDAEEIIEACKDITRNNIGARVMKMSLHDVQKVSENNFLHPFLKASLAYEYLHDSPLKFDRSIIYENRYPVVKRACREMFRDMRLAWPESE